MRRNLWLLIQLTILGSTISAIAAELTVHVDQPGASIAPTLYGAFFEDINRAGDGGLYAELVQNRSFEDNNALVAWTPFAYSNAAQSSGELASFALDKSLPLNSNNLTILKITIVKPCCGRIGIFSQGFKGIVAKDKFPETSEEWRQKFAETQHQSANGLAVVGKKEYDFSLYARAQEFSGKLLVRLPCASAPGFALPPECRRGFGVLYIQFAGPPRKRFQRCDT